MNTTKHQEGSSFWNIRVEKSPKGHEIMSSIHVGTKELALDIGRALKNMGYEVSVTHFREKKTERLWWKEERLS